jgi:copper chaperone
MPKEVNFKVQMSCGGCSGAVTRILKKIEGVAEVAADLETQGVKVQCEDGVDPQALLAALEKWAAASNKTVELLA